MNAIHAAQRHLQPYENILETIGWTPLIRLNRVVAGARTPVYAKAEFFNPGGSVKDRAGLAMIEAAERDGSLGPGGVVVEATSGNTGVGLAMAAALKGYHCIFTIPDKMSQEKVRLLRAYGAEVIITPTAVAPDHPDNYLQVAKRIVAETPGSWLANQFYNLENPEAHYRTTGPEIWEQTEGRVTHLVAGAGTGGTISGAGKYLKERQPDLRVIAADPHGSIFAPYHRTGEKGEGQAYRVEGVGNDKISPTLWFEVIDEFRSVSDREAFHMARRLTREEGLFVGGSSGLITHVAVALARELDDPDALIVSILPDTGERYLSKVYNEEWLQENRLLEPAILTAAELIRRKPEGEPALVAVRPESSMREALELMRLHDISQLPVFSGGESVGSLSESVLMARVIEQPWVLDWPVAETMEEPFPAVEDQLPVPALGPLLARDAPAVLVRHEGAISGIVTRYDVVQYLTK